MAPLPWLFSKRDVRDFRRLKKPLFLDSRFFSVASWMPGGGALAPESLEEEEEEEMKEGVEVEEKKEGGRKRRMRRRSMDKM